MSSHQVCVSQRGIRFSVALPDGAARGYCLELFHGHFSLPELGPIGAAPHAVCVCSYLNALMSVLRARAHAVLLGSDATTGLNLRSYNSPA